MTPANLAAEFRPYYEVKSNHMIWYDYAVIKLNHLFESMDHIGLTQKLDASLRLWLNCGTGCLDWYGSQGRGAVGSHGVDRAQRLMRLDGRTSECAGAAR